MTGMCKLFSVSIILIQTTLSLAVNLPEDKWYRIMPFGQGDLCYDVCYGSKEDRAQVILFEKCSGHKNQQFKFKRTSSNAYHIIPRHAYCPFKPKVLDICEGSMENRAMCILYHKIFVSGSHRNQEFYVTHAGGHLFRIINAKSGMPLGFDEDRNVCQKLLDFGEDTVVQLEEVN
ncbi:MAG: RICIN domain-containing protein [Oligoflexales bacterium]